MNFFAGDAAEDDGNAYEATAEEEQVSAEMAGNGTQMAQVWKPTQGMLTGIAVYLTIAGILSTIGNTLFIITVTRWRLMRNNAHMLLLLNMAVCDLAISVVGYPYTTISGYVGGWVFGDFMCTMYAFLCFTLSQVSMNTLLAVSIFRYIAICKPHSKHLLTPSASWKAISVVWAHALFWTLTPLFGWSSYRLEPTQVSCSLDWFDRSWGGVSYTCGCMTFCYILHLTVLYWCYKNIFARVSNLGVTKRWRAKRQQEIELEAVTPVATCESVVVFSFVTENLSPLELHVLKMNITMVLTFLICWTPYAVISLLSVFRLDIHPVWYIFPTMFAKLSCMMNPLVYGLTNRFLRKELISVLKTCFGLTTPMEEFQLMQKRQQEGLFNKEGIYTGGRIGSSCKCDRCRDFARPSSTGTGNISHRKKIDLFVRQLREREAEEERQRKLQELEKTSSNQTSARPTKLELPGFGEIRKSASLYGSTTQTESDSTEVLTTQARRGTCSSLQDLRISGHAENLPDVEVEPEVFNSLTFDKPAESEEQNGEKETVNGTLPLLHSLQVITQSQIVTEL